MYTGGVGGPLRRLTVGGLKTPAHYQQYQKGKRTMTRSEAWALVQEQVHTRNLRKHMLATEAVMCALAQKLGEDEEAWGLAGLLHDVDYDRTADDFSRHGLVSAELLASRGVDAAIIQAVKAHAEKAPCARQMDWALYASDPITGFLVACALVHPQKRLAPLNVVFVRNRMKEKSFARGASREQMAECARLRLELDEFIRIALGAMQSISTDLGL